MKRVLYTLLQFTWGFPQTLLGFILFLISFRCSHAWFHGAVCTSWPRRWSVSLGLFIFVADGSEKLAVHEYGHTIQSLIWGPMYLLTVGLPSLVWAKLPYFRKKWEGTERSYFSVYPEKQASRLGARVTGRQAAE